MRGARAAAANGRRAFELGLHGFRLAVLPCILLLGIGCRAVDSPEDLQALAGESAPGPQAEAQGPAPAGLSPAADDGLNGLPLVGPVYPGLGGRLHSALCDPASDPYGTCL